jgi:aspartate/methionine/tyrosine aminotransferase
VTPAQAVAGSPLLQGKQDGRDAVGDQLRLNTLVLTLNGLSKLYAAPEVKLGWVAVHGPQPYRDEILDELAMVNDLFLSASGFAEHAGAVWLREARDWPHRLAAVVGERRRLFDELVTGIPGFRHNRPNGGVHALVSFDAGRSRRRFGTADDEQIAVFLIREFGVYCHPGYLYGIEADQVHPNPTFVVSFLVHPDRQRAGWRRIAEAWGERPL